MCVALTTLTAIRQRPSNAHAKAIWVDRCGLRALGMIGLRMALVHAHTHTSGASSFLYSFLCLQDERNEDSRITPNRESSPDPLAKSQSRLQYR